MECIVKDGERVRSFVLFTNGVSYMWYTIVVCMCVFSSKFLCHMYIYVYGIYLHMYMSMINDCSLQVFPFHFSHILVVEMILLIKIKFHMN